MALSFLQHKERFILGWVGEEEVGAMYDGTPILVPGRDEVAIPGPRSRFRYPAAIDAQGRAIPGTVVIEDQFEDNGEGGTRRTFSARDWLTGLEAANRNTLFERGFFVCVDISEYEAKKAEAEVKHEIALARQDQETIATERARRAYWEKRGMPAPESSSAASVEKALLRAEKRKRDSEAKIPSSRLDAALGLAPVPPPTSAPVAEPDDQPEPTVQEVADALFAAAEKGGVTLLKDEYKGLAAKDEDVMRAVLEKLEAQGIKVEIRAGA